MSNQAGKYKESFVWQKRSSNVSSSTGADETTALAFSPNGTLWGSLQPNTGDVGSFIGTSQGEQSATIVLRQFVALVVRDRLTHNRTGLTWKITGVRQDYASNETVVEATLTEVVTTEDAND